MFAIFSLLYKIDRLVLAEDKKALLFDQMDDVAFYTQLYDRELGELLWQTDSVIKSYMAWENIFVSDAFARIWTWWPLLASRLTSRYPQYQSFLSFWQDFSAYQEEVAALFGAYGKRNYIIVLQNTAEKRPNGWFFGSFVFVSMEYGQLKDFIVIDSYLADWIAPHNRLAVPSWSQSFLLEPDFGFISSNKFGFTKMDGNHIRTLFNTTFADPDIWRVQEKAVDPERFATVAGERIHGVVFVRSDGLVSLLPDLQETLWERQFINASINLIRGEDVPNKKALYKEKVTSYFEENAVTLVENMLAQWDRLLAERTIQLYLPEDPSLEPLLQQYALINTYRPEYIYAWDTNFSFNKSDDFVTKYMILTDEWWEQKNLTDTDIVGIRDINGRTMMDIRYVLSVPDSYRALIGWLEQQYGISLRDRELGILALQPAYDFVTKTYKRRASKATVYFPPWTIIHDVQGVEDYTVFTAPFAVWVAYDVEINTNLWEVSVQMDITLP